MKKLPKTHKYYFKLFHEAREYIPTKNDLTNSVYDKFSKRPPTYYRVIFGKIASYEFK